MPKVKKIEKKASNRVVKKEASAVLALQAAKTGGKVTKGMSVVKSPKKRVAGDGKLLEALRGDSKKSKKR